MNLSALSKFVFWYLTENCDQAGVWESNFQLAEAQMKWDGPIDWDAVRDELNSPAPGVTAQKVSIIVLNESKWWVCKYIIYQHGFTLYDGTEKKGKFHAPVFRSLRRHNLFDRFVQMFPEVEIIADKEWQGPSLEEVKSLALEATPKAPETLVNAFFTHYNKFEWRFQGNPLKNWPKLWDDYYAKWELTQVSKAMTLGAKKPSVWEVKEKLAAIEREMNRLRGITGNDGHITPDATFKLQDLLRDKRALEAELRNVNPPK